MKHFIIGAFFAITLVFMSCEDNKPGDVPENTDSYLIFVSKTIESIDSDGNVTDTEVTEYEYDVANDHFWIKAITKDTSGSILKTVVRTFDANRMPLTETVTEDDLDVDIVKTFKVKYSASNYELLSKTEIIDGKTVSSLVNEYDKDGWLTRKTEIEYCNDSGYVNIEGDNIKKIFVYRYFPTKSARPKGEYEIFPITEKGIIYSTVASEEDSIKVGDRVYYTTISFNKDGEPVKYFAGQKDCADHALLEYYKLEKDEDGRILTMTSYTDEKLESYGSYSTQDTFMYNDDGLLSGILEHKYNDETEQFDRFHDGQQYEWIQPDIEGAKNFIDYSKHNEHYCFGGQRHSENIRKIVKFDEVGKKVIEFFNDGYNGPYKDKELKPLLTDRLTYVYKKYEKGERGGILKENNKKEEVLEEKEVPEVKDADTLEPAEPEADEVLTDSTKLIDTLNPEEAKPAEEAKSDEEVKTEK